MCMGIECGSGKGWKKRQLHSASTRHYPDRTFSVLLAHGNTLLCHYIVCIHIDFLPHHHPLWGNVNNAWRSPIARCSFARLLLSGTHSYLTCNFLWRSIVFQSTIIHFHLAAVLPWAVESNSRSTSDTVNSIIVESTLNIGLMPLVIQKKCHCVEKLAASQLYRKCYILILHSDNFCKLYFPWGLFVLLFFVMHPLMTTQSSLGKCNFFSPC